METNVSIQFNKGESLYKQLYNYFADRIMTGEFSKENCKLPSVRKLSKEIGVNTVTVVSAYKLLEQRGFVISKTGSGTFVAEKFINFDEDAVSKKYTIPYKGDISAGDKATINNDINFATAIPTPAMIRMDDIRQVINEVFERDGGYAFGYDETSGFLPLRNSFAELLQDKYNMKVYYNHIQIISGAQQGIDIIAKAMIKSGDTVLVENPTYTGAIAVFKSRGAKIIGVPMESDGMDMHILEQYIKENRPKLLYSMPNYHNPTTICYSLKAKETMLLLAKKYDLYIVEDDTLSDLNFENKSVITLKSMDCYERVIYIKSFSKILMPGLRLGLIVSPQEVFKNISHAKYITDLYSSGLIQRAFDLYLRNGKWEEHLTFIKDYYRCRFQKMIKELEILQEIGVQIIIPDGGLYFWMKLPEGISSHELAKMCAYKGVQIVSGNTFYIDKKKENDKFVRLCYSDVSLENINYGIKVIYGIIKHLKEGKVLNNKLYNSFY